jgi:hypothetical protein
MEQVRFFSGGRYLLHDCDSKFSPGLDSLLVAPKQIIELIKELHQFVRHPDER